MGLHAQLSLSDYLSNSVLKPITENLGSSIVNQDEIRRRLRLLMAKMIVFNKITINFDAEGTISLLKTVVNKNYISRATVAFAWVLVAQAKLLCRANGEVW